MKSDLLIKRWDVSVAGYGTGTYDAVSRGRALADAWRSDAFYGFTFKRFLSIANARLGAVTPRWGNAIDVCGKAAIFLENNRQYVRFTYPGGEVVLNAHPYDVEPEEYRPSTYRALGNSGQVA